MSNLDAPVNNTPYSDEDLQHFKSLLLEERKEAVNDAQKMKESLEDQQNLDKERTSSKDHHPGDLASDEEEKETEYILRERSRKKIEKIDAALERIENKTYGVCEDTGKKIQKERLEALPYARFSVEARKKDESEHPPGSTGLSRRTIRRKNGLRADSHEGAALSLRLPYLYRYTISRSWLVTTGSYGNVLTNQLLLFF